MCMCARAREFRRISSFYSAEKFTWIDIIVGLRLESRLIKGKRNKQKVMSVHFFLFYSALKYNKPFRICEDLNTIKNKGAYAVFSSVELYGQRKKRVAKLYTFVCTRCTDYSSTHKAANNKWININNKLPARNTPLYIL